MNNKQNGFTLVELAIALMVIGLLIGGVLKGQELIDNARIIRTLKDLNDYDTAAMIFRGTYNAVPGDIRRPERLPNCNESPCNATLTSITGNGIIDHGYVTAGIFDLEAHNFWLHLYNAGMIQNIHTLNDVETEQVINASSVPSLSLSGPFGGRYYISFIHSMIEQETGVWSTPDIPMRKHALHIIVNNLQASKIDYKIDDGAAFRGRIRYSGSCDIIPEDTSVNGSNYTYNYELNPNKRCGIFFILDNL
jgi:prepilin-type N-terminal cleavage/methylation domain-containing protein